MNKESIKKHNDFINEKLGVNEDGEILADFLINFLLKAEPGQKYLFVRNDIKDTVKPGHIIINELPELEKNVYKVYVDYSTKKSNKMMAYFDPGASKYTKDGYILYFTFIYDEKKTTIWKHYIYHEIHHGVQFMNMTKKRMLNLPKYTLYHVLSRIEASEVYQQFLQYYYQTISIEKDVVIPQLYGKLKYRTNIKSIDDLKKYFEKRDIYEYRIAYELADVDLEKLFNFKVKSIITRKMEPMTNREEMKMFFSFIKKLGKDMSKFETSHEFLYHLQTGKFKQLTEKDLMNDEELDATIKRYNRIFNKVGKKMIKRLDRTYNRLLDYYTIKLQKKSDS